MVRISMLLSIIIMVLFSPIATGQRANSKSGVAFDYSRSGDTIDMYDISSLGATWYYDYRSRKAPVQAPGVEYVQMVFRPGVEMVGNLPPIAALNPGATWLIGNEPDGAGQGNQTPGEYARGYSAVYDAIKSADPTARVFAGGISTISPLRLKWLDAMLDAAGPEFAADGWHIHPYILPEKCAWGLGYPVGIPYDAAPARGCDYGDRHADYSAFVEQVNLFTQWMIARGIERPIIVSEYGVLMTPAHGYTEDIVNDYMFGTIAYANYNTRIERIAWFSVNYEWLAGALFDRGSKEPTTHGRAYSRITREANRH